MTTTHVAAATVIADRERAAKAMARASFPTLLEDFPAGSPVWRDEIFGPVATVSRWNDFEAVLAEANDTQSGLAAVIWTRDLARSMQFIDEVQAGFVQVNQFSVAEASVEYGGHEDRRHRA
jgi:acyl-CoA reductase-like NAD-dependent aldehyde dehydrogenase